MRQTLLTRARVQNSDTLARDVPQAVVAPFLHEIFASDFFGELYFLNGWPSEIRAVKGTWTSQGLSDLTPVSEVQPSVDGFLRGIVENEYDAIASATLRFANPLSLPDRRYLFQNEMFGLQMRAVPKKPGTDTPPFYNVLAFVQGKFDPVSQQDLARRRSFYERFKEQATTLFPEQIRARVVP